MSDEPNVSPEAPAYGAPPQPAPARTAREELTEPARMSPAARVANIFFSPGEVFEDVRRSPRDWWLPMLLSVVVACASWYTIQARFGWTAESLARAAVDAELQKQGKNRKDLTEQERNAFEMGETIGRYQIQFLPLTIIIGSLVFGFVAAGFFRLIALLTQAQTTLFRLLSVVYYSGFVPGVVKSVLDVAFSFMKDPSEVDAMAFLRNRGLVSTSLNALVSAQEHPALSALLGAVDLFSIWLIALMVIGLVGVSRKLKYGTALFMVVGPYVLFTVIGALWALMTSR